MDRGKQWQEARKEREMEKNWSVKWSDSAGAGIGSFIYKDETETENEEETRKQDKGGKNSSMQKEFFVLIMLEF